jgi:hypothetical protein
MSISVFVLSCVSSGCSSSWADPLSKESYRLFTKLKQTKAFHRCPVLQVGATDRWTDWHDMNLFFSQCIINVRPHLPFLKEQVYFNYTFILKLQSLN